LKLNPFWVSETLPQLIIPFVWDLRIFAVFESSLPVGGVVSVVAVLLFVIVLLSVFGLVVAVHGMLALVGPLLLKLGFLLRLRLWLLQPISLLQSWEEHK
jgi:hypothetical protein